MNNVQLWLAVATAAAALGAWLALGSRGGPIRALGGLLLVTGVGLFASQSEALRARASGLYELGATQWSERPAMVVSLAAGVVLLIGVYLMLPRGVAGGRRVGGLLVLVAFALIGWFLPRLFSIVDQAVFTILAAVTIASAVATITFRSPVYSAIWFALTLLGTCGLFLFQGAQFLAVATLVVYAGAILVTLLFVLMLAQPEGQATYDRLSWEAFFSATSGALMLGVLTWSIADTLLAPAPSVAVAEASEGGEEVLAVEAVEPEPPVVAPFATEEIAADVLHPQHMAHLGGYMFSRNLVAIELAGTLLLVALVGAVAIVAQDRRAHEQAVSTLVDRGAASAAKEAGRG